MCYSYTDVCVLEGQRETNWPALSQYEKTNSVPTELLILSWRIIIVTAGMKNLYKGMEFRDRRKVERFFADHDQISVFGERGRGECGMCLTLDKECIGSSIRGLLNT